jgi:hypothetical protein
VTLDTFTFYLGVRAIDLKFGDVMIKLTQVIKLFSVMTSSTGVIIRRIIKLPFVNIFMTLDTITLTLVPKHILASRMRRLYREHLACRDMTLDALPRYLLVGIE